MLIPLSVSYVRLMKKPLGFLVDSLPIPILVGSFEIDHQFRDPSTGLGIKAIQVLAHRMKGGVD